MKYCKINGLWYKKKFYCVICNSKNMDKFNKSVIKFIGLILLILTELYHLPYYFKSKGAVRKLV